MAVGGEDKSKPVGEVLPAGEPLQNDTDHMDTAMNSDTHVPLVVLDERVQGLLGRKLSTYYGALVAEPVPATFVELLRRLEKKEAGQ